MSGSAALNGEMVLITVQFLNLKLTEIEKRSMIFHRINVLISPWLAVCSIKFLSEYQARNLRKVSITAAEWVLVVIVEDIVDICMILISTVSTGCR